ncbi:MAG: hypothetical protein R2932_58085 [Caldilineaceae bacterium]
MVAGNDHLSLGDVTVAASARPLPAALIPMQYQLNQPLGAVELVGYRAHRQGMSHLPDTPLVAGDTVELTFVWQAPTPLPLSWPAAMTATVQLGTTETTFPLAGAGYPTAQWQAGQVVQYTVLLPFDGTCTRADHSN